MPTTVRAEGEHSHCICGANHTNVGDHNAADVQNFEAWNDANSLPAESKKIYLTTDVTLTNIWYPVDGTVLCLNGHTINAYGRAITVNDDVHFTLTDCEPSGSPGKIISGGFDGPVLVKEKGYFTMYGGSITDGYSDCGGMVQVYGTFTMNGGSISNNKRLNAGEHDSSAVHVCFGWDICGNFVMNGGSISNNVFASDGSGVRVDRNATFTMNGGSIRRCGNQE